MSIGGKLFDRAREKFWNDYHKKVEEIGFTLSRDGSMLGTEGSSIVAFISPYYSKEQARKLREIIPNEYRYGKESIRVYIFPSVRHLEEKTKDQI